ncbi:MAG: metallopeptidase family protein [Candidatus Atribacteria bacterium]|nr:metallopeptidase family protein [Candidatus Atribacteria bacterium]
MKKEHIMIMVRDILDQLPDDIQENIKNLEFIIEDRPNAEIRRQFRGSMLLGLYHGVPLPKRGPGYTFLLPDRISLFYENLLKAVNDEKEWPKVLKEVILHEIGHYFGFNEIEIRKLMNEMTPEE